MSTTSLRQLRVWPVLDVQRGQVVHGQGGQRANYRPLVSRFGCGSQPSAVARALVRHLGARGVYLADLDAIAGAEPAWQVYRAVLDQGLELWVDAGPRTARAAARLGEFRSAGRDLSAVIAGLESLVDPAALAELVVTVGPRRLVFSLDLFAGRPWTTAPGWRDLDARQVAALAAQAGVVRTIVLDIATVGTSGGLASLPLCAQLRDMFPAWQIVTGGGVRGVDDLQAAAGAGCDAVLVASALYEGRIGQAELAAAGAII